MKYFFAFLYLDRDLVAMCMWSHHEPKRNKKKHGHCQCICVKCMDQTQTVDISVAWTEREKNWKISQWYEQRGRQTGNTVYILWNAWHYFDLFLQNTRKKNLSNCKYIECLCVCWENLLFRLKLLRFDKRISICQAPNSKNITTLHSQSAQCYAMIIADLRIFDKILTKSEHRFTNEFETRITTFSANKMLVFRKHSLTHAHTNRLLLWFYINSETRFHFRQFIISIKNWFVILSTFIRCKRLSSVDSVKSNRR